MYRPRPNERHGFLRSDAKKYGLISAIIMSEFNYRVDNCGVMVDEGQRIAEIKVPDFLDKYGAYLIIDQINEALNRIDGETNFDIYISDDKEMITVTRYD